MLATTIEQSRRLLSLGISPETADMSYNNCSFKGVMYSDGFSLSVVPYTEADRMNKENNNFYVSPNYNGVIAWEVIPSWSLTALFELLGKLTGLFKLEHTEIGFYIALPNYKHITETYNSPIDAAIEMVEWLIKKEFIK